MADENREKLAPLVESLTARELDVLTLIAQQRTNRQIAEELVLSLHTVKWYARQIYGKLGVRSRGEATTRGRTLGLIPDKATRRAPLNNLPAPSAPLFGRQRELAALGAMLANPGARLITITGVGGVGKTRLAHAAAERQLARQNSLFEDGVFTVSLSPIDNIEQLPTLLAGATGFSLKPPVRESRSAWRQLKDYLQQKRILLVLDNFEHLLPQCEPLSELLQEATRAQLLITSRERLNLLEERVFPLDGIAAGDWQTVEDAQSDPAVQLFLYSARRVRPDLELGAEDLPSLANLGQITAGLPLALELAASWVEVLPLSEIVAEIKRDLDFLRTDLRNVPKRQRSMRVTFEASWRRLDPALQDAYSRLSVFRGGFTREAAREVAGASLPNLAALSARSLLQYAATPDRYHLHELLRQFGEKKLWNAPEAAGVTRQAHAVFYCRLLHDLEQTWPGPQAGKALTELEPEMGNVRCAWRWAVAMGNLQLMADGLHSLCTFYDRRGYEEEARRILQAAGEALLSANHNSDKDVVRRRLLVRVLAWSSRFSSTLDRCAAALDHGTELLNGLKQQNVDVRQEELFLALRWADLVMRVDPGASRMYLEDALSLSRELGDVYSEARATIGLGTAAWNVGDYEGAAELVRRALAKHRCLGNRGGVARALGLLGLVEKHRGRLNEAQQAHRESYSLVTELGDRHEAAQVAGMLASTLLWAGLFSEAKMIALQGMQLANEMKARDIMSFVGVVAAWPCMHLGDYEEANGYVQRALDVSQATGDRQALGWAMTRQGQLSLAAASCEEAAAWLEEATVLLNDSNRSIWMLPLVALALAQAKMDEMVLARRSLARALHENMTSRVPFVIMNALPAAAQLVANKGDVQRALELYMLAHRYPYVANSRWFEDLMSEDIAAWEKALSSEEVAKARKRARARNLWQTAEELLEELGKDVKEREDDKLITNQENQDVP